jgi:hypothetical protein
MNVISLNAMTLTELKNLAQREGVDVSDVERAEEDFRVSHRQAHGAMVLALRRHYEKRKN